MKKIPAVLCLSMGIPAFAATYTVPAGSGAAAIQQIVNTAGAGPGNTVMFAAGNYSLGQTVWLPCTNGVVYTGPLVGQQKISYSSQGVMSISNLPTAIFTVPADNYVFGLGNNGIANTSPTAGCTIQYMGFNGTQGGIYVQQPSSGITIQNNAFYNNNPDWAESYPDAYPAINLDGNNGGNTPSDGVSYVSILWNTFFNNCASIISNAWPDAGGDCNAVHIQSYTNYLTINNNVVNQTEEGFKFYEQSYQYAVSFNTDVENNNMQGNSRIAIEDQQPNNANAVFSHNAFYQPSNPSYNTFELSIPLNQCGSTGAGCNGDGSGQATVSNDNVYLGNVPVTIIGSGAHYGIGLEMWGVGATAQYNLFQGGNDPDTCDAGWGCSGWGVSVGEPFSKANVTNNYFSGYDIVAGGGGVGFEAGADASNPGMVISPNTIVATSATIPTVAPAITTSMAGGATTVTITDSDTNHRLSFFYTTDGSTPAIFGPGGSAGTTQLYTGPFAAAPGTTVKALASWGQGANQGIVFPSFGYVPSAVTTLSVAAAAAAVAPPAKTLVGGYLDNNMSANTMTPGSALQFTAYGVYSDGSVAALPDTNGNKVTWSTTSKATARINVSGRVTAMAAGTVNVQAIAGNVPLSPWTVTISNPAATPPIATPPGTGAASTTATATGTDAASSTGATSTTSGASGSSAGPTTSDAGSSAGSSSGLPVTSLAAGPVPAGPGPAQPDAFLGPFWKLVNPVGGSASISNSHLFIGVPGGANHDALHSSNQAVRVLQTIGNANFDVAIKIDSPLNAGDASTSQGLMVISDNTDYLTYALVTNGTTIGLSANVVTRGVATAVLNDQALSQYQNPIYLRLTRTGSAYVALYSADGENWTQAASFTDTAPTSAIGPFASNYNSNPANAVPVVMSTNWFDVQ